MIFLFKKACYCYERRIQLPHIFKHLVNCYPPYGRNLAKIHLEKTFIAKKTCHVLNNFCPEGLVQGLTIIVSNIVNIFI